MINSKLNYLNEHIKDNNEVIITYFIQNEKRLEHLIYNKYYIIHYPIFLFLFFFYKLGMNYHFITFTVTSRQGKNIISRCNICIKVMTTSIFYHI